MSSFGNTLRRANVGVFDRLSARARLWEREINGRGRLENQEWVVLLKPPFVFSEKVAGQDKSFVG